MYNDIHIRKQKVAFNDVRTIRSNENQTDGIGSRIPMPPSTLSLIINCWESYSEGLSLCLVGSFASVYGISDKSSLR